MGRWSVRAGSRSGFGDDDIASDPLGAVFSGKRIVASKLSNGRATKRARTHPPTPTVGTASAASESSTHGIVHSTGNTSGDELAAAAKAQAPAHESELGRVLATMGTGTTQAPTTTAAKRSPLYVEHTGPRVAAGESRFVPAHVRRRRAAVSTVDLDAIGAGPRSAAGNSHKSS